MPKPNDLFYVRLLYNNIMGTTQSRCAIKNCRKIINNEHLRTRYCTLHKCMFYTCKYQKIKPSPYCINHKCMTYGCNNMVYMCNYCIDCIDRI